MQVLTPRIHGYKIVSRIGSNPITALEFAEHAKIDADLVITDFKTYLELILDSALVFAEKFTRRTLIDSNMIAYLDQFSVDQSYELRASPVASITSIQYYLDGALETVEASDYYITASNRWHRIFLASGESWPDTDYRAQSIQFKFVAGYEDDELPFDLKMALMQHALAIYANRGDCAPYGTAMCSLPSNVKNVYSSYKIRDIGSVV